MRECVGYEDRIVDLLHKTPQDDLTGQVNLKFQYSMTKMFTTSLLYRFVDPVLPGMIPWCAAQDLIFVWNFEFRSLEFI
jgi:hypothetical protein